ncbi:MAG: hypothetical protein MIO92_12205 [Methanosarcinaceae archaeon]|nr:hypothetical protein [Methanosarcinaceae archaeon]
MKIPLILFAALLFLSGCSPSQSSIQTAIVQTQVTNPTAAPIMTEQIINTPTNIPTLTPTQLPVYSNFNLIDVRYIEKDQMKITLNVPGILGEYSAQLAGEEYSCQSAENDPDQIECIGKSVEPSESVEFQLIMMDSEHVALTTNIVVDSYEVFLCGNDLTGTWNGTYFSPNQNRTYKYLFELTQNECEISGNSYTTWNGIVYPAIVGGSVAPDRIVLSEFGTGANVCYTTFNCSLDGPSLSGQTPDCGGGTFNVNRK